jgi:hypothetical protein
MMCEICQKKEAVVHLSTQTRTFTTDKLIDAELEDLGPVNLEDDQADVAKEERHFCEDCADAYYASTPGMNAQRSLICLSDFFRTRLYDRLEADHPDAFYDGDDHQTLARAMETITEFLRRELEEAGIGINDDAFGMLLSDFCCSWHFYERRDEVKKRRGDDPKFNQ